MDPVPGPAPDCKSCATQEDCGAGEICVGGSSRRRLRFGNIQDGCCRDGEL
jgi:hypothetical protein